MSEDIQSRLEAPGAGLPKVELVIARILSRWRRWTGNREMFTADFIRERELIQGRYRSCDPEAGAKRVLVERLRGMEDSSRYWSVWMVLDHLRIVNSAIAGTIGRLAQNLAPQGTASTAAVKPDPGANDGVIAGFESSCDAILTASAAPNLKTTARYAHPWFGPMDALGWYGLAGGHMAIHRVQIERILEGTGAEVS